MEPLAVHPVPSRFRLVPDPIAIGLSMANWLVLMLLMSGFLLATTASGGSAPAGTSSEIGASSTR